MGENYEAFQRDDQRLMFARILLEEKAGIHERMSQLDQSEGEPRLDIREIYFGVKDEELRKVLIAAYRKRQAFVFEHYWKSQIADGEIEIHQLKRKLDELPWLWPSVMGCGAIATGYAFGSIPGALAGALIGFFLGNSYISWVRGENRRNLEMAEKRLNEYRQGEKTEKDWREVLEVFSEVEERTGAES